MMKAARTWSSGIEVGGGCVVVVVVVAGFVGGFKLGLGKFALATFIPCQRSSLWSKELPSGRSRERLFAATSLPSLCSSQILNQFRPRARRSVGKKVRSGNQPDSPASRAPTISIILAALSQQTLFLAPPPLSPNLFGEANKLDPSGKSEGISSAGLLQVATVVAKPGHRL